MRLLQKIIILVLLEVTLGAYLWLDADVLRDVPPGPKQKIKNKYEELCARGQRTRIPSVDCQVLKDVAEKFGEKLRKSREEFKEYWNNDVISVLNKYFDGQFKEGCERGFLPLPSDHTLAHLAYLFDPINDDTLTRYKFAFANLAALGSKINRELVGTHRQLPKERMRKLKLLRPIVEILNSNIDDAANNVDRSESWQLPKLYDRPNGALYQCLEACKYLAGSAFEGKFKNSIDEVEQRLNNMNRQDLKKSRADFLHVIELLSGLLHDFFFEIIDPKTSSSRSNSSSPQRLIPKTSPSRRSTDSQMGHLSGPEISISARQFNRNSPQRSGSSSTTPQKIGSPGRDGSQKSSSSVMGRMGGSGIQASVGSSLTVQARRGIVRSDSLISSGRAPSTTGSSGAVSGVSERSQPPQLKSALKRNTSPGK